MCLCLVWIGNSLETLKEKKSKQTLSLADQDEPVKGAWPGEQLGSPGDLSVQLVKQRDFNR